MYVKKYADSGTRTKKVCFRSLLITRVQMPGLHKEICRQSNSNQYSLFRRLLLARVQLPGLRLLAVRTERSGRLILP